MEVSKTHGENSNKRENLVLLGTSIPSATLLERLFTSFRLGTKFVTFRSIGVSNYKVDELKEIMKIAKVKPAINQVSHCLVSFKLDAYSCSFRWFLYPFLLQIQFHPYNYEENLEILNYCRQHDIIIEAYSPL
jgi:diketogulonate reductase-like aldo/keto reductase